MSCASPKCRLSLSRALNARGVLTKKPVRNAATKKGLGTNDGPVCVGISTGKHQTMISGPAFKLTEVPRRFRLAPVRKDRGQLCLGLAIAGAVPAEQELNSPTPREGFPEWE